MNDKTTKPYNGPERRQDLPEWRAAMAEWQEGVESHQQLQTRKQRAVMLSVGAVALLLVVGFIIIFAAGRSLQNETNAKAAEQAARQAQAAVLFAKQIQDERRKSLVLTCNETNENNKASKHRASRIPSSSGRALTISILDSAFPYRTDCQAYADARVKAK